MRAVSFYKYLIFNIILASTAHAVGGYNEVYDDEGNLRPAYSTYIGRTGQNIIQPSPEKIKKLSILPPLGDKIRILPVPLILTEAENAQITKGTQQRARALMEFFWDVVSGKLAITKGRKPIIKLAEIRAAFSAQGISLEYLLAIWSGKDKSQVTALYGPDLVRGADGSWWVIEDNFGPVGGFADVTAITDSFLETPSTRNETSEVLKVLLAWAAEKIPNASSLAILDSKAENEDDPIDRENEDLEDERLAATLKKLNIPIYAPSKKDIDAILREIAKDSLVIFNFHQPTQPAHAAKLQTFFGVSKNTMMLNAPGTENLSFKGFVGKVEDMVRFYLGEEPILRAPKTEIIPTKAPYSSEPMDFTGKVVKSAQREQGKYVYLMPQLSPAWHQSIGDFVRDNSSSQVMSGQPSETFITQDYIEPSWIPAGANAWGGYYLNLRPITLASATQTPYVMPRLWGRAVSTLGVGLNNVSQGAMELVVLVEQTASCKMALEAPLVLNRK